MVPFCIPRRLAASNGKRVRGKPYPFLHIRTRVHSGSLGCNPVRYTTHIYPIPLGDTRERHGRVDDTKQRISERDYRDAV